MATYVFTRNGSAKTIQPGWSITESANSRNRMDFSVLSLDGSVRYVNDDALVFTEDGTRIFGGLVDRPTEAGFGGTGATAAIAQQLGATDNNIYASRIHLTAEIPAGNLKAALTVVVTELSAQGVTLHASQVNGPSLPALSYVGRPINEVLDEMTALASGSGATSFLWEIDYSNVLRGFEAGTQAAPFNIADGDGQLIGDITVEQPRASDYANYVIVLGGEGQRDVNDVVGTANGILTNFVLHYTLASSYGYVNVGGSVVGGAIVGGVNETLGAGATWTYDAATNSITRSSPPAAGSVIIPYVAQFPKRVVADGGVAAANRVMRTYTEPEVFDATVLQALADSYVVRDMASPKTVRYTAAYDKTGLHPGQTQTITSTKRNLSGSHLITDVRIVHVVGSLVRREVTAVSATRLPASLRQKFSRAFGGASGGGSSAGSVPVVSSSGVGGTGTAGTLPKWATATTIGDSLISVSGSAVTVAGVLNVTDDGIHTFAAGVTGANAIAARNTLAGAANIGGYYIGSDLSLTQGTLLAYSSTYTTSGPAVASGIGLLANEAGGLSLGALDGSGAIRQYWGGSTLRLEGTGATLLPGTNVGLALGSMTRKYLSLYAEDLHVQTLVAQEILASIGGNVLVAQTTTLIADVLDSAVPTTTIRVKHRLADEDRIYLKADGKVEWMRVGTAGTAVAGGWEHAVERDLDGTGANNWYKGDAVVDTGNVGDGLIDLYATSGILAGTGPTIVGNVRTGTTWNAMAPRWAVGNLNGVYGYVTDIYGAAFGDNSNAWVKIDPTNGVRIGHNATTKVQIDASGNASFTGAVTATSGSFTGSVTASSGAIGGFDIGSDYIRDAGNSFGLASTVTGGDDVRFWAGAAFASRGTAPLRITEGGALVATSATITGNISAASGTVTLDSDGITVTSGTGFGNHYKFSDGSYIASVNDIMRLQVDSGGSVEVHVGTATLTFDGALVGSGKDLGKSIACWAALYIDPATTTSNHYPLVHAGTLYGDAVLRKTNGYDGTVSNPTSITIEHGIVTACS